MRWPAIFLILFAAWGAPLAAQTTPTPTAEDGRIFPEVSATFPLGIYFRAAIALPAAEVARVTLTITPETGNPLTITYPTRPYDFAAEYVVASYDWVFTTENAPPLFSEVAYTWEVITPQERILRASGSVELTDQRAQWRQAEVIAEGLQLALPIGASFNPALVDEAAADAYTLLAAHTAASPALRFIVYPPTLRPGCDRVETDAAERFVIEQRTLDNEVIEAPCDLAVAEAIYRAANLSVLADATPETIANQVVAALIDRFYAPFWEARRLPAWFTAGVRQFYLAVPEVDALNVSRRALRAGRPLTLDAMNTLPDAAVQDIWLAQSIGMVTYTLARAGVAPVLALAQGTDAEVEFAAAFEAQTGITLDALIVDWATWVYTQQAASAYAYSLYLPATPTPTMTFTPTITRTPLPPTPTLTPSPDYTATLTPTRTPRPPTPTLTPLPPQGFSLRPTAVPALTNSAAAAPQPTPAQLIVLGVVVALIGVIVYLGLRRR